MDSRGARRAAEKAARALLHARATAVGDLAVADTSRTTAEERVTAAATEGQALIDAAKGRAEQLLTDAHAAVTDAQAGYAAAHTAALEAGWQLAELHRLGYPAPAGRRRRPRAAMPAHTGMRPNAESSLGQDEQPQHPAA